MSRKSGAYLEAGSEILVTDEVERLCESQSASHRQGDTLRVRGLSLDHGASFEGTTLTLDFDVALRAAAALRDSVSSVCQ